MVKSKSKPTDEVARPDGDEDGSMDTILASIRRILNEDEVSPAETAPSRPEARTEFKAPQPGPRNDDVFVLRETMMVPPEKIEAAQPVESPAAKAPVERGAPDLGAPDVATSEISAPSKSAPAIGTPASGTPETGTPAAGTIEGLIAARTRAATAQSFDALHEALRREEPVPVPRGPTILRAGGPTLEDLVRDELRGLLSNWLDVHLPGLVETLVRSEIEKLTRRG